MILNKNLKILDNVFFFLQLNSSKKSKHNTYLSFYMNQEMNIITGRIKFLEKQILQINHRYKRLTNRISELQKSLTKYSEKKEKPTKIGRAHV